jgi:hypothetical protein
MNHSLVRDQCITIKDQQLRSKVMFKIGRAHPFSKKEKGVHKTKWVPRKIHKLSCLMITMILIHHFRKK